INKNGKGGVMGEFGVELPPNFVVEDNGGPGIVILDGGGDSLILENVKVRNNTGTEGDGIGVSNCNVVIKGTGNEITNNGRHGISTQAGGVGDVTIEGTTEIHDNGGWGICAEGGKVNIHDGAMSSINKNGKGGIMGEYGVKLPPNFVVEDNGGPGIVAMECEERLVLENVKIRNNNGDGIGVISGSVTIRGTGNEITNNGRHGIFTQAGDVIIEGPTEIHDNGGWGIRADEGLVEICDGVNISGNGQGDIYCPGS
ncbi:MAG: right-handed parallel beta-helix repeat-containing protein, partial [Dehalococcoidia bacterium]|nr:right-handed parallel beta-helix repeat-containing protein [Dehalococcoidia bacterium]